MLKQALVVISIMILLVMSSAVANISVTRNVPKLESGKDATITLTVNNDVTDILDIAEFVPVGWEVSGWNTVGISKTDVSIETYDSYTYQGSVYAMYHWKIVGADSKDLAITYSITPKDAGDVKFTNMLIYPSGFSTKTETITVDKPVKITESTPLTGMIVAPEPAKEAESTQTTQNMNILAIIVNDIFSQSFY